MSDEFYLPLTLKPAPAKWLTAALVALHCAPLPLLLLVDAVVATPLAVVVVVSLLYHLHRQKFAADAVRIEATAAGQWLLHHAGGATDKVNYIDQVNLGAVVLLLMRRRRRRFHLIVNPADQNREQLHRLRILRMHRRSSRG